MHAQEQFKLHEVPAVTDADSPLRERAKFEQLVALLEAHRGERHIIVLQSFPDPDAISADGERELIGGSLRTKKPTFNPDTFLKEALGGPAAGRYYGGGRREAGGFEIVIGFLAGNQDDEFRRWKWRLYDE